MFLFDTSMSFFRLKGLTVANDGGMNQSSLRRPMPSDLEIVAKDKALLSSKQSSPTPDLSRPALLPYTVVNSYGNNTWADNGTHRLPRLALPRLPPIPA